MTLSRAERWKLIHVCSFLIHTLCSNCNNMNWGLICWVQICYLSGAHVHHSAAVSLLTKSFHQLRLKKGNTKTTSEILKCNFNSDCSNKRPVPCPACGSRAVSWVWRVSWICVRAASSDFGSPGTLRASPSRTRRLAAACTLWETPEREPWHGTPAATAATPRDICNHRSLLIHSIYIVRTESGF